MKPAAPNPAPPPAAPATPPPLLRPTVVDYFLMVAGFALSLYLTELSGYQLGGADGAADNVPRSLHRVLPRLVFLPLGPLLCWPLFYATQRLYGRPQALTAGEWLWGVAWLVSVALTVWIAWQALPDAPEMLKTHTLKAQIFVVYSITALALGTAALAVGVISLVGLWRQPWTHAFGLVLLVWPALPLAALLAWKLQLE